ncbi:hypothetical protein KFL_002870120 [Klebsormidium nitens]|uniref:Uncharacterized protein n=1 Tax=Klebsormidium nitens TaxID=105231 RepID=A0A1Y1IEA0_KLENI|nr:hypothetical protein KFL_002870120 [Klebsormidium nitens]|eukprot:GAQ86408.1 hypothetical protein KFL_002870120 [Klebsormidium nitens]
MVLWCSELTNRAPLAVFQPRRGGPPGAQLLLKTVAIAPPNVNALLSSQHGRPFVGGTVLGESSFFLEVCPPGSGKFYTVCYLGGTEVGVRLDLVCEPGTKFRLGVPSEKYRGKGENLL